MDLLPGRANRMWHHLWVTGANVWHFNSRQWASFPPKKEIFQTCRGPEFENEVVVLIREYLFSPEGLVWPWSREKVTEFVFCVGFLADCSPPVKDLPPCHNSCILMVDPGPGQGSGLVDELGHTICILSELWPTARSRSVDVCPWFTFPVDQWKEGGCKTPK